MLEEMAAAALQWRAAGRRGSAGDGAPAKEQKNVLQVIESSQVCRRASGGGKWYLTRFMATMLLLCTTQQWSEWQGGSKLPLPQGGWSSVETITTRWLDKMVGVAWKPATMRASVPSGL